MFDTNTSEYRSEYAKQAPLMRAKWRDASPSAAAWAHADVLETIQIAESDYRDPRQPGAYSAAYVAKLYAELDALRDRRAAIAKAGGAA